MASACRAPGRRNGRPGWRSLSIPRPVWPGPDLENAVFKLKDALLRRGFTDKQIEVAYHHLTRTDHDISVTLGMATYGGRINTVATDATASAHRDSVLTTSVTAGWEDPRDEALTMMWVRRFYRDLFADTGGVPVPGRGHQRSVH